MPSNLNKAFDMEPWEFLQDVLDIMLLSLCWQNLIMQCVTTTSLKIKINGDFTPWFYPTSRLRQGTPCHRTYLSYGLNKSLYSAIDLLMDSFGDASGLVMNKGYIDGPNVDMRNTMHIINHQEAKLNGWKASLLSQNLRHILISSILSSIPIYHMHYAKLSDNKASKCDSYK
ncbi:Transposon TX1 uncharacterized 149 kDa protein [Senna tora]|uniref:Transposon TX1 uncharacterized 149 kDa protein n=1 Tax=Senna tora TaxID=362788 RepID=A0A834VYW6_9FABA|nr:Transposon TX1 uncharacterized 149 kDa protein [Senna tora]